MSNMSELNEDRSYMGSSLSSHKRYKNELKPPLLQLPNLELSNWLHNRLPEMLWAVLVVGNLERDKALEFFRYIGTYVGENKEFYDVSLTGLGKLPPEKVRDFIKHMLNWSEEVSNVLRALRLYPEVPAFNIWNELLDEPILDEDWEKLFSAVQKSFDHQSQEATDCRWIRILCLMVGGKIHFLRSMEEIVREIAEYPHCGDLAKIRPTIRSMEMCTDISFNGEDLMWPKNFWKHNYNSTRCIPEVISNDETKIKKEEAFKEIENSRNHFVNEIKQVRNKLITHFFESVDDTRVNPRHETSFGLALYSLTFFSEIIFYRTSNSITGRVALRSLIEVYITFRYLLKKEQESAEVWDDFHSYGTGQIKLVCLKLNELSQESNCIELDELYMIMIEDMSVEFIPINLGQWGKIDLRKMSEYADVKEVYDLYYSYTSGFVHGTRGAIRESVYQRCLNPLHRYHRIPQFNNLSFMPDVTLDSVKIVNKILECLSVAYPTFNALIELPPDKEKTKSKEE